MSRLSTANGPLGASSPGAGDRDRNAFHPSARPLPSESPREAYCHRPRENLYSIPATALRGSQQVQCFLPHHRPLVFGTLTALRQSHGDRTVIQVTYAN